MAAAKAPWKVEQTQGTNGKMAWIPGAEKQAIAPLSSSWSGADIQLKDCYGCTETTIVIAGK